VAERDFLRTLADIVVDLMVAHARAARAEDGRLAEAGDDRPSEDSMGGLFE